MKRQATDWRYLQIIYRLKDLCTEHKKNSYDSIIMWYTTQFQNEQPHETSGITGQGVWQIFSPKSNDKIWQNYQNNHFRTLEMDQWHATNWETFTQENLLNLGKNSGIWHFSLEYLPLHPPQPRTLPPHAPPANTHTHNLPCSTALQFSQGGAGCEDLQPPCGRGLKGSGTKCGKHSSSGALETIPILVAIGEDWRCG